MIYLVASFIIGAVIGSFLNVCIYRFPRQESVVFPASHCPACNERLRFWDLLPILSYFLLRGQCRYCKTRISWRYPLVEFVTALLFTAVFFRFGIPFLYPAAWLEIVVFWIFVSLLTVAFFTDLEHQLIPDQVSIWGIVPGLLFNFIMVFIAFSGWTPFFSAVLGMALAYLFLAAVSKAGKMIFKKEALGEGDIFLAVMIGAFLGWQGVVLTLFLAYFISALVILLLMLSRKLKMGDYVPFGPALIAGALTTLFFGDVIINWYWTLFVI